MYHLSFVSSCIIRLLASKNCCIDCIDPSFHHSFKNVSSYFQLPSWELSYPCPYRHFWVDDVPFPKVGYVPCKVYTKKTHTTSHRDSVMFRPGWLVVVSIVLKIKPRQLVEKKIPSHGNHWKKPTPCIPKRRVLLKVHYSGYLILLKGNLPGGTYIYGGPTFPNRLRSLPSKKFYNTPRYRTPFGNPPYPTYERIPFTTY